MDRKHLTEHMDILCQKGFLGKFVAGKGMPARWHFNPNIAFFGSKMNDMRDYERFNRSCVYTPECKITYKGETDKGKMIRRDL
jgi:hypothetical protein